MRRILCFLTVLLLVAAGSAAPQLVVDNEELLTSYEASKLEDRLCQISDRWQIDVVVVTADSLDGKSARAYADDFYDYGGYGEDGILLLVNMQAREYWISTAGDCIGMEDEISDSFAMYLSTGDYYDAFTDFADQCDAAMEEYREGDSSNPVLPILICLGIGAVVGLIVTGVMASQLKSIRSKPTAGDYVVSGSLHLTHSHDLFLYRNVRRTPKPQNNGTHRGSSGRSHGGRGGRF